MEHPRDEDIIQFLSHLAKATASITEDYMRLRVAGSNDPVHRERVYCYELYHQLRKTTTDNYPYMLCGEIDKQGHAEMRKQGLDGKKPDFLVHIAGKMNGNLAVLEVKPVGARKQQVEKDLKVLTAFRRHAKYRCAVYLVYGTGVEEFHQLKDAATSSADCNNHIDLELIDLYWHKTAGRQASRQNWL